MKGGMMSVHLVEHRGDVWDAMALEGPDDYCQRAFQLRLSSSTKTSFSTIDNKQMVTVDQLASSLTPCL